MNRFLRLPSFAALTVALTTLITAGPADARTPVRSVKAGVTVSNAIPGWSLSVRLAPGTRLQSVSGGTASARRGAIVVQPKRTALTLVTRGAGRPKSWSVGAGPCAVKPAGRSGTTLRLKVACVMPTPNAAPGAGTPAPAGEAGTTPAANAAPGGDSAPVAEATPTATATPTPTPTATPEPGTPYRFAPYVDFAGWPMPELATMRADSGVDHISLGFVVQGPGAGCDPTWGGAYPATGASARGRAEVQAFQQAGGDVVPSFGGQAGTELALACTDLDELVTAYQGVIDTYGATHVDFDIEGATIGETTANTRRAQAIVQLQQANPGLVVTYTIPTDPTGPDTAGRAAIENAVTNGVDLAAVNIMTMDYWGVSGPAGKMGAWAIQAGTALHGQLATLYPALSDAAVWRKVGITPMLGINDFSDQIFSVQDARDVAAWASTNQIGMLGMWALERDNQCDTPVTTKQLKCSGVTQTDYEFASSFQAFTD